MNLNLNLNLWMFTFGFRFTFTAASPKSQGRECLRRLPVVQVHVHGGLPEKRYNQEKIYVHQRNMVSKGKFEVKGKMKGNSEKVTIISFIMSPNQELAPLGRHPVYHLSLCEEKKPGFFLQLGSRPIWEKDGFV